MKPYLVTADDPTFNALFYGDPGSGKTSLAASAQSHPKMANVLFANIEGGLLSIAHREDTHAVDISKTKDVEDLFWTLAKREKPFHSVNTVVHDSTSELQTLNLEEIVTAAMSSGKNKDSHGRARSRDDIWQEDYGESTSQLRRIYRWYRDLPINVIFTALAKRVYPKVPRGTPMTDIEPLAVMPMMTEKLGLSLMGMVDFVWYCYHDSDDDLFKVLTRDSGVYRAKTRGPRFQKAIGKVFTVPEQAAMSEVYDIFVAAETGKVAPRLSTKSQPTKKRKVRNG